MTHEFHLVVLGDSNRQYAQLMRDKFVDAGFTVGDHPHYDVTGSMVITMDDLPPRRPCRCVCSCGALEGSENEKRAKGHVVSFLLKNKHLVSIHEITKQWSGVHTIKLYPKLPQHSKFKTNKYEVCHHGMVHTTNKPNRSTDATTSIDHDDQNKP